MLMKDALEHFGFPADYYIYNSWRHKQFVTKAVRASDGKTILKQTDFDLTAFQKFEADEQYLVANAGLFIEYVKYEKNMKISQLSRLLGIVDKTLYSHDFAVKTAIKILSSAQENAIELVIDFCNYYNIPYNPPKKKVKWSIWGDGTTQRRIKNEKDN